MRIAAILVAAGSGSRFGAETPKQFQTIAGKPVIRHAAEALAAHVSLLQPVGDAGQIEATLKDVPNCLPTVPGGATRQDSVRAGLEALAPHGPDIVLVHDAARPVIPHGTILALIAALREAPGAIPAAPVAETIKRVARGLITETVSRTGLFRAQTPQAFRFAALLAAHRAGLTGATDDASLLEAAGQTVEVVPGSDDNIKLTYPEDIVRLERIMSAALITRVGTGFDVHAFAPGRHFPPRQAAWKDADSARFLTHAAERIAANGGRLANADITLICERPKITPHAPAMIARLASLLGVAPARISVKATTTERLGFTGRGEGIAAQAVVSILLPDALPETP